MNKKSAEDRRIAIVWGWTQAGKYRDGELLSVGSDRREGCELLLLDQRSKDISPKKLAKRVLQRDGGELPTLILLHRRHGYTPDSAVRLGEKISKKFSGSRVNIHLFGDGEGPLYLSNNRRGLLGTKGALSAQFKHSDGQTEWRTALMEEEGNIVKQAHFNMVWDYYHDYAERLLRDLRDDLLEYFDPGGKMVVLPAGAAYASLRNEEDNAIIARLLSLLGRLKTGSSQEKQLLAAERTNRQSLRFPHSDALAQDLDSATPQGVEELRRYIKHRLLGSKGELDFKELRHLFAACLPANKFANEHR
ncbi:MAG: hypothetical protein WBA17_00995 [Saprospiraceae bacterium]